jgi:Spy/CpxP family protein refolding chaperone
VKGPAAAAYGPDAATGIVIIYVRPGPGLRNCTAPSGPGDDALGKLFLPPDLVMSHQQAINLTEQQRLTIQSTMMDTQRKLLDQQFKLNAELEKLKVLLTTIRPDEAKVLDEMDKVLGAERDIKRAQLSLMVKLKNSLTQQQQSQLETLRNQLPEK